MMAMVFSLRAFSNMRDNFLFITILLLDSTCLGFELKLADREIILSLSYFQQQGSSAATEM